MAVDLTTRYLGLTLRSPLVLASCPLGRSIAALQRLEAGGLGAVVLPSLFQEQLPGGAVRAAPRLGAGWDDYFDQLDVYNEGEREYLRHVEEASQILSIPVIASLNGATPGGWVDHARRIEDAGASALELNLFDVPLEGSATGREIEARLLDVVEAVRERTRFPIAIKIGSQFSSLPDVAARLEARGAEGIVLFNSFFQPDLDLETLELRASFAPPSPEAVRLPLFWIAILRDPLSISIAASGGAVHAEDVVKLVLVGADVVQMATGFLRHGPPHAAEVIVGVGTWLEAHGHASLDEIRGICSRSRSKRPEVYQRLDYTRVRIARSRQRG